MDLSKLSKNSLEGVVTSMLEDLEKESHPLAEKYDDLICEMLYYIDDQEAEHIVKNMKPYGEVYSIENIESTLEKNGINHENTIDYYLDMNMFYNDFKAYPESKRLDVNEFCFEMSKMFINDIDAPKHKTEKYFSMFSK